MPNWEAYENGLTATMKTAQRRKRLSVFASIEMKEGEVYDPLKEVVISIADAPTSSLNRISKSLNAMYKAADITDSRRDIALSKKREIDNELESRNE